jgi:hypothetical protein
METAVPPSGQTLVVRLPWQRRLRDGLLLPFAVLLLIGDYVLRKGSRILRHSPLVRALEAGLGRLPPWAILPLFLIPEAMSHFGGFYAAYLLAHKHLLAATIALILVKGVGLVIALWIYQACRPALMTIGWFAWAHGKVEAARRWTVKRIWKTIHGARVRSRGRAAEAGAPHARRRLLAIRARLAARLHPRP